MSEVFYLLCGLLYLIGLPLGWNYEETSVYICIYAFPVLVTLPFLGMFIRMLRLVVTGRRRVLGGILLLISAVLLYFVSGLAYAYFDLFHIEGTVHEKFLFCMHYLQNYAGRVGTTYEMLNMMIYVIAPLAGFVLLAIIYLLSLVCKRSYAIDITEKPAQCL